MTRLDRIFADIDRSGLGLEIGPSHNPAAPKRQGFRVETADHLDRAGLVEKYTGHGVDLDMIEDVDYIWNGEPLSELIGTVDRYDWIIASHVIEHVPDLAGFLNECRKLLKAGGTLSLAIPDKRYCFDHHRPLSTTGDVLQAFAEKRKRHPPGLIFDYFSSAASLNGNIAWGAGVRGELRHIHSIEEAWRFYEASLDEGPYIDIHAWRFTPGSFRLILQDLQQLGIIDLSESRFFDSMGCEFHVSLRPGRKPQSIDRPAALRQIQNELANGMI